jgi:hypothetical protein
MRTRLEVDRAYDRQALKSGQVPPLTPGHTAAAAAVEAGTEDEVARRHREHVQHEVDPYLHEAPEVAHLDLRKAYRDAVDLPVNPGYPAPGPMGNWGDFRREPLVSDHAAYSPGYDPSPMYPHMFTTRMSVERIGGEQLPHPAIPNGQSRPCAPEAC